MQVTVRDQMFNPLTPRSDRHENSPHNILISPSKQIMRIFKLIIQNLLS